MLEALPAIIAAASKPMENIDKISIVDARGLHGDNGSSDNGANGSGNLADAAVAAAMRYRVGGPLIDSLMAELGMDGSSLNGLLAGGTSPATALTGRTAPNGGEGHGRSLSEKPGSDRSSTDHGGEARQASKAANPKAG